MQTRRLGLKLFFLQLPITHSGALLFSTSFSELNCNFFLLLRIRNNSDQSGEWDGVGGGREVREGRDTYIPTADSRRYTAESNTTCKAITPQSTTHTDRKVSVLAKTLNQRNHARFRVLEAGLFLEWGITIGPPGRTGGAASDSSCFYLQTESDPSGVCRPGLPCL